MFDIQSYRRKYKWRFKFSLKCLLLINYCMWNLFIYLFIYLLLIAILRAHVYMLQSYFFISFKVSVGWSDHPLCKFRKIIARRRLEKEIKVPDVTSLTEIRTRINGVAKVSYQQVYSWSLHEHKSYGPGWAATGKRVFQFISASKYSKRKIIMQRGW